MADSNHYGPGGPGQNRNGGPGYRYNSQYSGGPVRPPQPPKPPKGYNDVGEWVAIAILFLIPSIITKIAAAGWFAAKIAGLLSKQQKDALKQGARRAAGQVKHVITDMGREVAQETKKDRERPGESQDLYGGRDVFNTGTQREARVGLGLIIGGGVATGVFGLASLGQLGTVLDSLFYNAFFGEEVAGLLIFLALLAGGVGTLCAGIGKRRRAERYLNYLGYIGANREVPLAHMASTFGVSVNKLCKDLRRMLAKGVLPAGYLDLAEGKLFLTEMGYRQPEPEQTPTAAAAQEREDDILRQIRQINDQIPDEVMSRKIDRIEEITGKILAYQKAHPDREAQLRSFLNYYLPTTLKILRAYAQLEAQGIEGENISAAKARIEGMMDQVVAGFEKQLDKLFRDDAMDITSDVEVLENMLKKDGLSDDGMTMSI